MGFSLRATFLLLLLSGCATNLTAVDDPDLNLQQLRASNKGIVLLHTSLHLEACMSIKGGIARPNGSGRWVYTEQMNLKFLNNFKDMPSQIVLDAGEYAIVDLLCEFYRSNRYYGAKAAEPGNILTGVQAIFDRPIVTFSVGAGEVVDIGTIELPTRTEGPFLLARNVFNAVVKPLPEPYLKKLAEMKPNIYAARIVRLAKVPPPVEPREAASAGDRR